MTMPPRAFLDHWQRIHERTMAVARCVPAERTDWSPGAGAMTLGDTVRHIALTGRWLFVEVACGRPSGYYSHGASWAASREEVLMLLERLHGESVALVRGFSDADWEVRVQPPGGASLPAWKWLRAMCEHEIHHRGQLYLALRLAGVATPPIFGLTSEEVRARAGMPRRA